MQELSAQAADAPPLDDELRALATGPPGIPELLRAVQLLGQRFEGFEATVADSRLNCPALRVPKFQLRQVWNSGSRKLGQVSREPAL